MAFIGLPKQQRFAYSPYGRPRQRVVRPKPMPKPPAQGQPKPFPYGEDYQPGPYAPQAPGQPPPTPEQPPPGTPQPIKQPQQKVPDWTKDPIYERALAQFRSRFGEGGVGGTERAGMLENQKKLLLGFGSQELARSILGADDPFVGTVSADPNSSFSFLANLARKYSGLRTASEDAMGASNLAFGSARGLSLTNLATAQQGEQSDQETAIRGALGDLTTAFTGAFNTAQTDLLGVEQGAYERALAAGASPAEAEDAAAAASGGANRKAFVPQGRGFLYKRNVHPTAGQKLYYRGGRYYAGPR